MKQDIAEGLETMIDRSSLLHVVSGLVLICTEKAQHIREHWQDETAAKSWDHDARLLEKILGKLDN